MNTPPNATTVMTSSTQTQWKSKHSYVVGANYQARMYYFVEHKQLNTSTQTSQNAPDPGQDSIERTRSVISNGVEVFTDSYNVTSNGTFAFQMPEEHVQLAPVGKTENNEHIMSIYSYQGALSTDGFKQWTVSYDSGTPSVDPGQYQLLIDSNGYVYNEIPTSDGPVAINSSWNDDIHGVMIMLNKPAV